ncbi:serine kinase [bacterium]|nr:serine kinase [candidate division CSSED10-310 bacterium]
MNLRKIVDALGLTVIHAGHGLDREIGGGYAGDLLSDVIASGKKGDLWITIQVHENIIAVAVLKDLAAIVLAKNSRPLEETLASAREEGVILLSSSMTTFEIVTCLAQLGLSGTR